MGSKSNSATSSTNTTQDFAFNNVDNAVDGEGGGGANKINFNLANSETGGINITNTDQGAIDAARDIALSGIDYGKNTFDSAIAAIQETTGNSISAVSASTRGASEESLSQFMKVAGIVILGGGAIMLLAKRR